MRGCAACSSRLSSLTPLGLTKFRTSSQRYGNCSSHNLEDPCLRCVTTVSPFGDSLQSGTRAQQTLWAFQYDAMANCQGVLVFEQA